MNTPDKPDLSKSNTTKASKASSRALRSNGKSYCGLFKCDDLDESNQEQHGGGRLCKFG